MKTRNSWIVCHGLIALAVVASCVEPPSTTEDRASDLGGGVECTSELLQANGLDIISTDTATCDAYEPSGDERCELLAQYAGLSGLELSFYHESTGEGTVCGCQCKDDDGPLTPCISEVRDRLLALPGGGWDIYDYYDNYILLSEVAPDYDINPSEGRCDAIESVTGISMTTEVIEIDGKTYLVCGCDSLCGTDDNVESLTDYYAIGWGNSADPFRIYTAAQLYSMSRHQSALNDDYELCKDIDLALFYDGAAGQYYFSIGSDHTSFRGTFDGNSHSITGYRYDDSGPHYRDPVTNPIYSWDSTSILLRDSNANVGLFGRTWNATIHDLTMVDAKLNVADGEYVATLAGRIDGTIVGSSITNITVSGTVSAHYGAGGMVGGFKGQGANLTAAVQVTATGEESGGLIADFHAGYIEYATATGDVTGTVQTGGLIGESEFASAYRVKARGNVVGTNEVGGLVGFANGLVVQQAYAHGDVTGVDQVGGLIGHNRAATTRQAYARGKVVGNQFVGGLVGENGEGSDIVETYARGRVTGVASVGGIVGYNYFSRIEQSYADNNNTIGVNEVGGLVGKNGFTSFVLDSFTFQSSIDGLTDVGFMIGENLSPSATYVSNLHYLDSVLCTNSPCTLLNGEVGHGWSYFLDPSNPPMNWWDFFNAWTANPGASLPYFDFAF